MQLLKQLVVAGDPLRVGGPRLFLARLPYGTSLSCYVADDSTATNPEPYH